MADLQSTACGKMSSPGAPTEKINGHGNNDSPSSGKPFSYSPIPPRKPVSSVSDLDSLLDDLGDKSKFFFLNQESCVL